MKTETFAFDKHDLPYEDVDLDFDTILKQQRQDNENEEPSKTEKLNRRGSLDSFQTETVKEGRSGNNKGFSSAKSV